VSSIDVAADVAAFNANADAAAAPAQAWADITPSAQAVADSHAADAENRKTTVDEVQATKDAMEAKGWQFVAAGDGSFLASGPYTVSRVGNTLTDVVLAAKSWQDADDHKASLEESE
jgi:hypothetical protein